VPRFGRGRAAELGRPEGRDGDRGDADRERAGLAPERAETERREREHGHEDRPPAAREISSRVPEVLGQRSGAAQLGAATADADLEAAREDEIREPEGDPEHTDDRPGDQCLPQPVAPRNQDERGLRGQYERAVRVGGHRCERCGAPGGPAPAASVERPQQRQVREQREEEEEAVHPAVHAVEEEDPACRCERRGEQGGVPACEPYCQHRDEWQGRDRERGGEQPQRAKAEPGVGHGPCEQEVKGGAAAFGHDLVEQERRGRNRHEGHARGQREPSRGERGNGPVGPLRRGLEAAGHADFVHSRC
jgi:hypothetical protein